MTLKFTNRCHTPKRLASRDATLGANPLGRVAVYHKGTMCFSICPKGFPTQIEAYPLRLAARRK